MKFAQMNSQFVNDLVDIMVYKGKSIQLRKVN